MNYVCVCVCVCLTYLFLLLEITELKQKLHMLNLLILLLPEPNRNTLKVKTTQHRHKQWVVLSDAVKPFCSGRNPCSSLLLACLIMEYDFSVHIPPLCFLFTIFTHCNLLWFRLGAQLKQIILNLIHVKSKSNFVFTQKREKFFWRHKY